MQNKITVVTDGTVNMDRIANSSISSRLVHRDEKWMRCLVDIISNLAFI